MAQVLSTPVIDCNEKHNVWFNLELQSSLMLLKGTVSKTSSFIVQSLNIPNKEMKKTYQ